MKIQSGIRKTASKSPPSCWHSAGSKSVISLLFPASKGAAEDGSSPVTTYSTALWTGCCEVRAVAFNPLALVEEGAASSPARVVTVGSRAGARPGPAAALPSGETRGTSAPRHLTAGERNHDELAKPMGEPSCCHSCCKRTKHSVNGNYSCTATEDGALCTRDCGQVTAGGTPVDGFKNIHQNSTGEHNLPGFLLSRLPQTPFCFQKELRGHHTATRPYPQRGCSVKAAWGALRLLARLLSSRTRPTHVPGARSVTQPPAEPLSG